MYPNKVVQQQCNSAPSPQHSNYTLLCVHACVCVCVCADRSSGLVFGGKGLPEEQLEHSGRDVGDDFCHRHPGVPHLQFGNQDPGHAQGPEAAEDPEAATVSGSPRDANSYRRTTVLGTVKKESWNEVAPFKKTTIYHLDKVAMFKC